MRGWKPFFIWNGISSYEMGVEVLSLPPIVRPEQRVEQIKIPGRHGVLHVTDGTFEPVSKPAEIAVYNISRIDSVFAWLRGAGEVVFGNERDKKYEAFIINKIPMEQVIRQIKKARVDFFCQPFKYELKDEPIEIIDNPQIISNPGTMPDEPLMTVYGTGDIEININGRAFVLQGITDYINIDTKIQNAYRGNDELMNKSMSGAFPFFDTGENRLSWTGSVSKIVIYPRWRWL